MKEARKIIRALLVDDEPLARERLRALLAEADIPVQVIGEAGGGHEAIQLAHELRPDVVFLDVQMPVLDGFDVAELLPRPRPLVVFVTAHDDQALRAFEVEAIDYLTKPVRLMRLNGTLSRLAGQLGSHEPDHGTESLLRHRTTPLARITVHVGRRLRVTPIDEVRWFQAREGLVVAHLITGGAHVVDFTLDELESRLAPERFIRAHRSHIIHVGYIRELVPWFAGSYVVTLDDGTQLQVARRRVRDMRRMLGN